VTDRRIPLWLSISIAATALLCLVSMGQRHQVESRNRAVGLVADVDLIQSLAAGQQIPFGAALDALGKQGLTGVVLPEETIADLVTDGRAAVGPHVVRLTEEDGALRARVGRGLTNRFGTFVTAGDSTIPVGDLSPGLARTTSIGLDPDLANEVRSRKMAIVARLGNPVGVDERYVRESIKWAAELGATVFLAQGEQVLGRRDALDALVDQLTQSKVLYATPEFAKIGGDANVVAKAPENVIRLHSAQAAELDKLSEAEAIERYGKAAAERNQRILLLRPLSSASAKPVDGFGEFVGKVRTQIEREGMEATAPHPYEDSQVPVWLFVAIAISTIPAFAWLLLFEMKRSPLTLGLLGFGCLLALATALPVARGPFALLCTMAYPLIAFGMLERSGAGVLWGYLRTSLISIVGGLCVAGLLNGLPFFVKADAFEGVKVAHFLPVALIGIVCFARGADLKAALRNPVFWGQAVLGCVLLVAFALMATRTGNDNPAAVSGLELKMRALLDQFLYVRPRTKEFLIGHPAMIVALGMLASKRFSRGWLAIALMVGAIGQTSMVNTMCHLHTPLALSLARIGVGWVLGGIIGAMVWGALSRLVARHTS